ncbi:precorrin-6A synthase (deacetylating) [Granulicoccus phenolivorans]|uniref:precorrin-6A synthase (deacetylating) n=1 Tax=Granulicoccus phenolivorans TaxID=266854 RepID=UPI00041B6F24|nr:precorrin-6A synthase (deacetylating) [Granulicoccus phenolivorans]
MVKRVWVIGIGPGGIDQVTVAAIRALNRVEVFLVPDKGAAKHDLVALREQICATYIDHDYRIIEVPDPERGPDAERSADQYAGGVRDWHRARADRYAELLTGLPEADAGFLVWGDPAFYDSTLRILDTLQADGLEFEVTVVPGISAIQLLAGEHRTVLNRIGQPIHITTGRRLVADYRAYGSDLGDLVVMLDGALTCRELRAEPLEIFWGAYLGAPEQVLRRGRLDAVIDEIVDLRARLRAAHGWIMDTYLLRPITPAGPTP